MGHLTQGLKGRLHRGRNRGGKPWTQFRFAGPDVASMEGPWDALFYRIDRKTEGYYFSVRQYQAEPFPDLEAKEERLDRLREWWEKSARRNAPELSGMSRLSGPESRAEMEWEVACYLLSHNPPAVLRKVLPALHRSFRRRVRKEGWPLVQGHGDLRAHAA